MKKYCCSKLILSALAAVLLAGCGGSGTNNRDLTPKNGVEEVLKQRMEEQDNTVSVTETTTETVQTEAAAAQNTEGMIDLCVMNANMVYSEVFAMMNEPEQYIGKTVRMKGTCNRYTDVETGADYYGCIITDAAACCAQGVEFRLPEGEKYPQMGENIMVQGTFGSYNDGKNDYFALLDARLIN